MKKLMSLAENGARASHEYNFKAVIIVFNGYLQDVGKEILNSCQSLKTPPGWVEILLAQPK